MEKSMRKIAVHSTSGYMQYFPLKANMLIGLPKVAQSPGYLISPKALAAVNFEGV